MRNIYKIAFLFISCLFISFSLKANVVNIYFCDANYRDNLNQTIASVYENPSQIKDAITTQIEQDFVGKNEYLKAEMSGRYSVVVASVVIPITKINWASKLTKIKQLPKLLNTFIIKLKKGAIEGFKVVRNNIYGVVLDVNIPLASFSDDLLIIEADKFITNYLPSDVVEEIGEITYKTTIDPTEYTKELVLIKKTNGNIGISRKVAEVGGRFIAKSGNELKTFLNGITDLPTGVTYKGKMYRYIPSQYSDAKLIVQTTTSDAGNRFRTGLYLSETKAGNIIEVNSYGGTANKTLYEFTDVEVNNILDLTDLKTVEKLGTSFEQMKLIEVDNAYEFTREVAIWAKNNGYSGIKFLGTQGGTGNYTNFVIFEQQVVNSSIKGSINSISW